jgi:hypothetical protein
MNLYSIVKSVLLYVAAWFVFDVVFFWCLPTFAKTPKQIQGVLEFALPASMFAFSLGLVILLSSRLYLLRKERLPGRVRNV